jgi:hypothetical protein
MYWQVIYDWWLWGFSKVRSFFSDARVWMFFTALVVLIFVVQVVWGDHRSESESEDVATRWNKSIGQLGIEPVFPPDEDFYVGDVLAIVAIGDRSLQGKSVRIAHLDLGKEVSENTSYGPIFGETPVLEKDHEFRRLERAEISSPETVGNKINLRLVAFPGVTITRVTKASGSLGLNWGWFGAGRDDQENDEIRIPIAESYGVAAPAGLFKIINWCKDDKTAIYCRDEFVRSLVAYSVGSEVLRTDDQGNYINRLELRLVSRVFLMREIEHRVRRSLARSGAIEFAGNPATSASANVANKGSQLAQTPTVGAQVEGAANSATEQAKGTTVAKDARNIFFVEGNGSEVQLKEVFQRPLVFGYRFMVLNLKPAEASKEPVP